jgi:hypothetical protein
LGYRTFDGVDLGVGCTLQRVVQRVIAAINRRVGDLAGVVDPPGEPVRSISSVSLMSCAVRP